MEIYRLAFLTPALGGGEWSASYLSSIGEEAGWAHYEEGENLWPGIHLDVSVAKLVAYLPYWLS
jgi:hypothetical protein